MIAAGTALAFLLVTAVLADLEGFPIEGIPVEPIAVVVLVALLPVAAYVATARDSRRFVIGAMVAIGFWFVLWYPNIAALPLPVAIHNAYQGFLPTYIYDFQFAVSNAGGTSPSLFAIGPAIMLAALLFMTSSWPTAPVLADRSRGRAAARSAGGAERAASVGGRSRVGRSGDRPGRTSARAAALARHVLHQDHSDSRPCSAVGRPQRRDP